MRKLKNLAIAYKLAGEFDYCPSEDQYEEAKEFYGDFPKIVLIEHQGSRQDEIASMLVDEVLSER